MKAISALALATLIAMVGCTETPKVPEVKDPANPVDFQGNPISGADFVEKYCQDAEAAKDKNCINVTNENTKNFSKRKNSVPKGW